MYPLMSMPSAIGGAAQYQIGLPGTFHYRFELLGYPGDTLVAPWYQRTIAAPAGTPTFGFISTGERGFQIATDATNEAQSAGVDWRDQRRIPLAITDYVGPICEWGFTWDPAGAAGDANTKVVIGIKGAHDNTYNTQKGAYLSIQGANLDLLVEAYDGTTDRSQDSGVNVVKGEIQVVQFDLRDLHDVRVWHGNMAANKRLANWQLIDSGIDLSNLDAGGLQPCARLSKDSGIQEAVGLLWFGAYASGTRE